MVPPPVPRRGSQAGRRPATAGGTFATSSPWRWLASGGRTRRSFATGSLDVIIPVRTLSLDLRNPFLVCLFPLAARPAAHPPTHPKTAGSAPWRPISTAGRRRVRRIPRQSHQPGRSASCLATPAFELAARSLIFDRFHSSSFSFSALTRRSPTLCARAQAASQPVSTLGQRQRPSPTWGRRLPSRPAILALVRARSGRSRRPRRVPPWHASNVSTFAASRLGCPLEAYI